MLLHGIGDTGQAKLASSKALLVGCGALGTSIADGLVRAGVGTVIIVDRDFVELTNLQRQVLFDEADVANGTPKAEAACIKLARVNSEVTTEPIVADYNPGNAIKLAEGCDVIVDGTDNFETRFLINDVAVKLSIPYVYGGAVGTTGMIYTMPADGSGPCLRCLFGQAPAAGTGATCDTAGVLGPAASIVAGYQVTEALKILTGNADAVNRRMVSIDLWENTFRQINVDGARDQDCVCCAKREFEYLDGKFGSSSTVLCGRNAVQVSPEAGATTSINFDQVGKQLEVQGEVKVSEYVLRATLTDQGDHINLTLFRDGRAIIQGTDDISRAKSVYSKYVGL